MAASGLRRLVDIGTFEVLQDKLDKWSNDYYVSTSLDGMRLLLAYFLFKIAFPSRLRPARSQNFVGCDPLLWVLGQTFAHLQMSCDRLWPLHATFASIIRLWNAEIPWFVHNLTLCGCYRVWRRLPNELRPGPSKLDTIQTEAAT